MRLRCQKSLLLLALFTLACHDATGPQTVNARFELQNIDGRPLPTPPAFTPGMTPTILSSVITLDQSGTASFTEHRTEWNGVDAVYQWTYTYKIVGDRIAFEAPPCPPNAICADPPTGRIFINRMTLEAGHINSTPILYNYFLIVLPELPH